MAFFLNNNTLTVFKAAKLLTAQSKDFTICIKKIEKSTDLTEIIKSYQQAAELCGEMEQTSMQSALATGIDAAEKCVTELIDTMKQTLTDYIQKSSDKSTAYQAIMNYESVLVDEILEYLHDTAV